MGPKPSLRPAILFWPYVPGSCSSTRLMSPRPPFRRRGANDTASSTPALSPETPLIWETVTSAMSASLIHLLQVAVRPVAPAVWLRHQIEATPCQATSRWTSDARSSVKRTSSGSRIASPSRCGRKWRSTTPTLVFGAAKPPWWSPQRNSTIDLSRRVACRRQWRCKRPSRTTLGVRRGPPTTRSSCNEPAAVRGTRPYFTDTGPVLTSTTVTTRQSRIRSTSSPERSLV